MKVDDAEFIVEMQRRQERESAIFATLDPTLPDITRIMMAGDYRSAEDHRARFDAGEINVDQLLNFCGSYSRIDTLVRLRDEGKITTDEALDRLPLIWPISDPDDTDERFIELWYEAFWRQDGLVRDEDEPALPPGERLTLWRGQRRRDPLGCAWSLSRDVALRFAKGASFRVPIADPEIIEIEVPRGVILAYLTGRGEDEIIIDSRVFQRTGDVS